MSKNICRAITFINYHIPIRLDGEARTPEYITVGFFDGMFTESLKLNYKKDDLRALWRYSLKKTAENKGYYSFQNVFGFSRDEWNVRENGQNWTDEKFWAQETDGIYPLTFVVFLQLKDYMVGDKAIEEQCKAFNKKADASLRGDGISYTYATVDKNDFIISIKCRTYEKAVRTIKQLHNTNRNVVYSYSIFSVNSAVLKELHLPQYQFLFEEKIASICLKGITNSYDSASVTLEQKYRTFCKQLIQQLYNDIRPGYELKKSKERKLYDILGDNDFRLIARQVNLGKLLCQFAPGGVLCYTEKIFSYYLFSSNLVLNTLNDSSNEAGSQIDCKYTEEKLVEMDRNLVSPKCDELMGRIPRIQQGLTCEGNDRDEKIVTFCQALFQLLQSLKVLEGAPAKQYDFLSLYPPFRLLVEILEEKLEKKSQNDIGEYNAIYEFIHTISMTLHGTLRTDIQFFQIRDFNVIVHYAPAKLRAYYAIWALKLKNLYEGFGQTSHQYSFIFAPGMYKGTSVQELFEEYGENKRLMLITVPERHLYVPRWLVVVMAHEVSHYVGRSIRKREKRHNMLLKMSARVLELEIYAYMYHGFSGYGLRGVKKIINENGNLFSDIEMLLLQKEKEVESTVEEKEYIFHSKNSVKTIVKAYYAMFRQHWKQISHDYSAQVQQGLISVGNVSSLSEEAEITKIGNSISEEIVNFGEKLISQILKEALEVLEHAMSETYADIIAVLTLELSPEDYIISFTRTELGINEITSEECEMADFLHIRIAIVLESICTIVENNRKWFDREAQEFGGKWSREILAQVNFLQDYPREQTIVKCANEYKACIDDWTKEIDAYIRRYQPFETEQNSEYDFLEDKKIWDWLCEYLIDCGTEYIQTIKETLNLKERRESLVKSYKQISSESEIDLMDEIECFLQKWEYENNPMK